MQGAFAQVQASLLPQERITPSQLAAVALAQQATAPQDHLGLTRFSQPLPPTGVVVAEAQAFLTELLAVLAVVLGTPELAGQAIRHL